MYLDENLYLKPSRFMGYSNRHYINTYYLNLIDEKSNFKDVIKSIRLAQQENYADNFFSRQDIFKSGISEEDKNANINKAKQQLANQASEDVDNTLIVIFNQTLVSIWGIFEIFLTDCMDVILTTQPKNLVILLNKSNKDKIGVNNVGNFNVIFDKIKSKYIESFDKKSVVQKITNFNDLGFNINNFFNFSATMKTKYPKPMEYLKGINFKRKNIVHDNTFPISDFTEIEEINSFITSIMLISALEMEKYFGCMCDFTIPIKYADKAQYVKWR